MSQITIDNSKEASVGGAWSNPGASLYDKLLGSSNYKTLLKEVYAIAPVDRISNTETDRTSFSASGVGYPHHVVRNGKVVLHRAGLRAAFSRARQQGVFTGELKSHLIRHYKEMGWYEESTMSESEAQHDGLGDSVKMDSLQHHGILGMRWGVRRERGADGRVQGRGKPTEDYLRMREARQKGASQLSDAQLRAAVNRMQLERQYKDLTKKEVSRGRKIAEEMLISLGKGAANEIAKSYTKPLIEAFKKK